jgi:hypothetical protein
VFGENEEKNEADKYSVIDLFDKRQVVDEENKDLNLSTSVKDNEDQTH